MNVQKKWACDTASARSGRGEMRRSLLGFLVLLGLWLASPASAQVITTVAGNGDYDFCGDGGPAVSACLSSWGVALDAAGNLFIADSGKSRIRRVDASANIITTVAGNGAAGFCGDGGAATNACLSFPFGVALDAAGNLFIADTYNYRIRKVGN